MRQIDLREYEQSGPHALTPAQRDALQGITSLTVDRADTVGPGAEYYLTPGSTVGAIELADLSVLIQPKIGIPQLLSMACYAMGAYKSQGHRLFDFEEDRTLPRYARAGSLSGSASGVLTWTSPRLPHT